MPYLRCVCFFPFYMLLLLTQFLCYSFLSSFLTDDTRSGKVSFDGFFWVHVHFTVVFLLITTTEEEKTWRCPGSWDVGSCNLWELNVKWKQAFQVCTQLIRCVSLSMMLALIWHCERVKCQLASSTFANNETSLYTDTEEYLSHLGEACCQWSVGCLSE